MRENGKRRVVVTGIGTINPMGDSAAALWEKVSRAESAVGPITHFDAADYKTRFAAEVKAYDPEAEFGRREARRLSRVSQFALTAAARALEDAALTIDDDNRDRIGVVVGSGMGSLEPITETALTLDKRGPGRVSPFFVPMMLADTPAAMISIAHGVRGPNMSVATACATGNDAIGQGGKLVERGAADVVLAGGSEACIVPIAIAGFSVMKAMSQYNEDPQRAARPFDLDRDGFVVGEGAAILVLESLDHARARGARILGELLGYGASADAYHISMPAEDGGGASLAMEAALEDAGVAPARVSYINCHGTGTQLNDKTETLAIKNVFGDHAYELAISSTKSMHGHLLGAAGALEAVVCLQSLRHNLLPPTINYETPDPDCDLDVVPNAARPAEIDLIMSNGFGLGGHNASVIFGRVD